MELEIEKIEDLPKRLQFSLKELEEYGVINRSTAKVRIKEGKLKIRKEGIKTYVTREEVIRYFYSTFQ